MKPGSLRETMPIVAGWIDGLREGFDAAAVNAAIRASLDGQPTFHASENGVEVGTPLDRRECITCAQWRRPGQSAGYCVAGRADLDPAYGPNNPLRRLPADRGKSCKEWIRTC